MSFAIIAHNLAINAALKTATGTKPISQAALLPFTTSTDNWLTATNQTIGFGAAASVFYNASSALLSR